jgi:hypothetical protein
MSITVTISVQVTDFDQWKIMFDSIESHRASANIHAKAYRKIDDPNCAYVIGTAPSKEIFFEFFTSPERQEIQDSGIIISQPEIAILEEA